MQSSFTGIQAIVFDYGNTLVELGPAQMRIQFAALHAALERLAGPCNPESLRAIRDRQVIAPYHRGYREHTFQDVMSELVRELYRREPEEEEIRHLMDVRYRSFQESIERPNGVADLLGELRGRFRLALLSNYPCGDSIRESLARIGLSNFFDAVVVSGDLGWVKPHPAPFQRIVDQMGIEPGACIFVGDNWLADVQGAKRAGMKAVYLTQHESYEKFQPSPEDRPADAHIGHLMDLRKLLAW